MSALNLADLHLETLYERDADGLIAASRDPAVLPPLFHLVRTADGNRWLLGVSLSLPRRQRLAEVLTIQPRPSGYADAESHPPDVAAIRVACADDVSNARDYRGPAFLFPDQLPQVDRTELLSDLSAAPRDGPFAWLRNAGEGSHPIAIVRADDGDIASLCHSSRSTLAAAEAGVETIERYRGNGYGSAAVVAWATAVRRSGRVPLYSTEWENRASRALASRLGLIWYAEDVHLG